MTGLNRSGADSQAGFLQWGVLVLAVVFLITFEVRWYLTTQLPFMMDELVDTQLAVQVSRGATMYRDLPYERMPLMTFLLAALHDPSDGSFAAAVSARRVLFVLTLLTFVGTWLGARNLLGNRAALLAPALLATFSHFLQQSIRVRADSMSTTASTVALAMLGLPKLGAPPLIVAGLSLGVAFGTTQKAVYFVISFAVGLACRRWVEEGGGLRWFKRIVRDGGIAAIGFFTPLVVLGLTFAYAGGLKPFLRQTLLWGAQVGLVSETYTYTWKYVRETLERNPAFWILGFVGAGLLLWRMRTARTEEAERRSLTARGAGIGAWTACLLLLLLQHKTKFPYVFVNPAPALAICGAVPLTHAARFIHSDRAADWTRVLFVVSVSVMLVIVPAYHHVESFSGGLLWLQKEVMDRVDAITAPEDAVLDGTGMATTRRKATPYSLTGRWFSERRHGAPYEIIPWLRQTEPEVMIFNYRLKGLREDEIAFLRRHFVQDWGNVHVVGATIAAGETGMTGKIDLLATTTYFVDAADLSRVEIDGRPAEPFMNLTSGTHEVRVSGPGQQVQLRLAQAVKVPPPRPTRIISLYPSYSAP